MKKILIFLSIIVFLLLPSFNINFCAEADLDPIYAKISYSNVFFYSLPKIEEENKLFVLPQTYFVKLLASEDEKFYYAQYDDIFGYIQKEAVTPMKGTPKNPYATSQFRIFYLDGLGLYKKPNMTAEKLEDIPYLSEELTYYGSLQGQEVIPEKSNQWYYAKYSSSGNLGYVYSVFCDKLPKIQDNTETFEILSLPIFDETLPEEKLSPASMTFIIIGVSLPCLIVLYLLVKPSMIKEKLLKTKPKLKAKRNRDYFEFDESDLN